MPQAPRADASESIALDRQTESTPPEPPSVGLGNPTTLLLLLVAAAFLWWSMRRRRSFEERLREQRHEETVANAELSARNVANIMRAAPSADVAAAAASEGLASAARMPVPGRFAADDLAQLDESAAESDEVPASVIERGEAAALAERAADEEARKAARSAELAGESEARRLAAAASAAEEARADGADALRAQTSSVPAPGASSRQESVEALRTGLRELDNEPQIPLGAIAGDGTAICPPGFPVKGNAQSMIYHEPGQVSYPSTVPEFCFASAEAAEAAGFRQSRARGRRAEE